MSSSSNFDEFKRYLPQYLPDAAVDNLFDELKQFPDNVDERMYSSTLVGESYALQGDGVSDLLVLALPDTSVRPSPCIILSNTCDISAENIRPLPTRVVYAPIVALSKVESQLKKSGLLPKQALDSYVNDLRLQRVSNIFYLPAGGKLDYEGMALLDRANNCPLGDVNDGEISERRLFTLSDYGFYLFLFKLSIHFTRIRERIARS